MKFSRYFAFGFPLALAFLAAMSNGGYPTHQHSNACNDAWGFYGHRRINRMATFTLPSDMMPFFRYHIEYLTEHAVDPDKRRYATKHEAVRHYIDIDHWGKYPFDNIPREWTEALLVRAEWLLIRQNGDTLRMMPDTLARAEERGARPLLYWSNEFPMPASELYPLKGLWVRNVLPQYYEEEWILPVDTLLAYFPSLPADLVKVQILDHFSEYGIIPYHLEQMQTRLTRAFAAKDAAAILRLSAEMGHYIGDAHVPLHTTENYNGQLTNQVGIHAFWESRLPELYADDTYDFFVGKAQYIEDKRDFFWKTVLDSHSLVDSMLRIEKRLSQTYPSDQQYCYEERLGLTIRTQCEAYANAYHQAMGDMVEARMRASILAIGSSWYTAWIDAGQPNLSQLLRLDEAALRNEEDKEVDKKYREGNIKGRAHEN